MPLGIIIALAAAASGTAPVAKQAPAKPKIVAVKPKSDITPEQAMAMVTKMMDKLFPPGPEPEPARLAAARVTVQTMMPNGAYAQAMNGLVDSMVDHGLAMSEADWVSLIPDAKSKKDATPSAVPLRAQLSAKDPNFDAKVAAGKAFVATTFGKVGAILEPRVREGMARSVARKFDAAQLAQINAFLATPTGQAYGHSIFGMWFDPDVFRGVFQAMPELMKLAPDLTADAMKLAQTMDAKPADAKKNESTDKAQPTK